MPPAVQVSLLGLLLFTRPVAMAASLWECGQEHDGTWDCTAAPVSKAGQALAPGLPAAIDGTPQTPAGEVIEDSAADPRDTLPADSAPTAPLDSPDAAEPAMQDTTAQARPTVPGPETPALDRAPADSAPAAPLDSPATTEAAAPDTTVDDRPAEPGEETRVTVAAMEEPAPAEPPAPAYDPWALCPPVNYPAGVEPAAATDTIELQADEAMASDGNLYTLSGNAVVQYGRQRLSANNIVYRQDTGEIEAVDGLQFSGPDLFVEGANARLYPEQQTGSLRDVTYGLPERHGRGGADAIHLSGTGQQQLEQASYTTCPQGNTDWVLSAREVELDQTDGTGTARGAKLEFKDVPILYTPYISFPLDDRRKSGLLVPKYGTTDETGVDVTVPWYWNIAPNYDATIVPRYMSDRGIMMGGEFRYLHANNSGKLSAEYLPSDDRFNDEYRSLVALEHTGNPWPRLETYINASNVSDADYFENFGTTLVQTSQISLERTAAASYHGSWWDLGLKVQDFQTIDPAVTSSERPYKQLPSITFAATPDKRLLGLKISTHAEVNNFKHSDSSVVTGTRFDIQPRFGFPVHRAGWYVDPAVGVRHTVYDLEDTAAGAPDSPSRTTPVVSLDAGTFFERNSRWGNTDFVQTLEPRLFYLYVPYKNQDDLPVFDTGDFDANIWTLFRENRFNGPDRMGDANQLALAVTSRFLEPASGRQRFSASLGSLLYFSDRKVTLPGEQPETDDSSDLFGEMTLALARNWNADAEVQWNPHSSQTSRNDYRLQYHAGPRKLVNLSYRFRRDSQEQTDLSFLWPLSPAWHMVGRWYYSLDDNETIEALAGLGYESCCWGARVVGRSFINDDSPNRNTEVYFQIEFKGLSKLGTKVDDALERGILGYKSSN